MAETGHIYIYGEIIPWEDDNASQWGGVNLKDVQNQLKANAEADELMVHINSNGGDVFEGFAIHDMIKATGKKITTIAEGMVASIATVIMLSGEERQITPNSSILIHNPWGLAIGDQDDIQKYADELKKLEERIENMYSEATGMSVQDISDLMKEERTMDADEALEKGFVTAIVEQIKAVATINKTKFNTMKKEDVQNIVNDSLDPEKNPNLFEKIAQGIKDLINPPKSIVLQTGNGTELKFSDVEEGTEPEVGDKATVEGTAAKGDYTMPNGAVYTFENGELTVITPPDDNDSIAAIKAELAKEKARSEQLEKDMKDLKDSIESDTALNHVRETMAKEGVNRSPGKPKEYYN